MRDAQADGHYCLSLNNTFPRNLFSLCRYCNSCSEYRQSSGYDGLDLRCFEVTNAPHKNIKDNDIDAVKLDHCDQELQYFHTAIFGSLAFVICILNDVNNCELLRYERAITTFQSRGTVFMMFRLTPKFGLHRVLRTDQRRESRTLCKCKNFYNMTVARSSAGSFSGGANFHQKNFKA